MVGAVPEIAIIGAGMAAPTCAGALHERGLGQPYLSDRDQTLFAGGDWRLGAKVEDAWTSERAIAEALAQRIRRRSCDPSQVG